MLQVGTTGINQPTIHSISAADFVFPVGNNDAILWFLSKCGKDWIEKLQKFISKPLQINKNFSQGNP
jgi:hypothetical protein